MQLGSTRPIHTSRANLVARLALLAGLSAAIALPARADDKKDDAPSTPNAAPSAPPAPITPPPVADPIAKQALDEAAMALKSLPPITFTATAKAVLGEPGKGGLETGGKLAVRLLRSPTGTGHSYAIKGSYSAPAFSAGSGPRAIDGALIGGKTVMWMQAEDESRPDKDGKPALLYTKNTLYTRPMGAREPGLSFVTVPSDAFQVVFLEAEPFAQERAAAALTLEKPQSVAGEDCVVVQAMLSGGRIKRVVYLSALDKLPRRYEQYTLTDNGKVIGSRTFEFADLNMEKAFKADDLAPKAPSGWKTDVKTDADYPELRPQPAPTPAAAPAPATRDPAKSRPSKKHPEKHDGDEGEKKHSPEKDEPGQKGEPSKKDEPK